MVTQAAPEHTVTLTMGSDGNDSAVKQLGILEEARRIRYTRENGFEQSYQPKCLEWPVGHLSQGGTRPSGPSCVLPFLTKQQGHRPTSQL